MRMATALAETTGWVQGAWSEEINVGDVHKLLYSARKWGRKWSGAVGSADGDDGSI